MKESEVPKILGILYLPHLPAFKRGKFQPPTPTVTCSIYKDFWQRRFHSIHFSLVYTFSKILPDLGTKLHKIMQHGRWNIPSVQNP